MDCYWHIWFDTIKVLVHVKNGLLLARLSFSLNDVSVHPFPIAENLQVI